jgi:alkyl sulfatase BDS1-like metallo-beta-lactamase superfamily hydrolase
MGAEILELADRAWNGDRGRPGGFPAGQLRGSVEVTPGTLFVAPGHGGNVTAFRTDDGLLLFDTGGRPAGPAVLTAIRAWDERPVHTAVYSHGHLDHVFGILAVDEEARSVGRPLPRVVAHEALPRRFDRYTRTAGYNAAINGRQLVERRAGGADPLGIPLRWPVDYRYPDETYRDQLTLELGGEPFELHHGRGETDDHTWLWAPRRGVLCTGDFFIWVMPNAGNPQKVQRYALDWARALRAMAATGAAVLLPGHGFPIVDAKRVQTALGETAELLESLYDQTVAVMNEGARLDEVLQRVRVPEHLAGRPFLAPIYDEPEFLVRNIWRLYGGWYDGNPANLKPAPEAAVAAELAALAGGANRLAQRAQELANAGDLRLAGHLAEMAALAAADDPAIHAIRAEVYSRRAATESSLMARGIFLSAAEDSRRVATPSPTEA